MTEDTHSTIPTVQNPEQPPAKKTDTMAVLLLKDSQQDRITKRHTFCKEVKPKLKEIMGDKYHTINEVGTPIEKGGNDHDLRIFTNSDLTDDERTRVLELISGYGLNSEVFFSDKNEFVHGGFKEAVTARKSGEFIAEKGYDPETASIILGDNNDYYTGLAVYLASSMRDFDDEGHTKPSEIGNEALSNINLTQQGGVGFANLYIAEFVHDYVHAGSEDEFRALSDAKLAKYLVRIKLGKLIAETNKRSLTKLKNDYASAVRSALEQGISPDEKLAQLVIDNDKSLSDEEKSLLEEAGKVRTTKSPTSTGFRSRVVGSILTDSALLNADKKHGNEDAFRALSNYLLVESLSALDSGVSYETVNENTTLTTAGENNDNLYVVPFNKKDGNKNPPLNVSATYQNQQVITRNIEPGRIVGAFQALSSEEKNATATVTTTSETEFMMIRGEAIRNILSYPALANELFSGKIKSKEAKALHILLTQLPYTMVQTLGEISKYTSSPNPVELHDKIVDNNPLSNFYDPNKFSAIINDAINQHESDPDSPLTVRQFDRKQVLYHQGSPANGKLYFVRTGAVQITGVGKNVDGVPTDIILEKGFTIGEHALYDSQAVRSAKVEVDEGTTLVEIDADWLMSYALSNQKITAEGASDVTSAFILYHLAALTAGRVLQRINSN
ncbi:cyclic nucleotide-binding domain-containing protein [Candidatus Woesebacteria bacterium]|nr:MAG: cyclic nucleotide-binding domain-containing protein [Candidatus Woesebacteria bacterium]